MQQYRFNSKKNKLVTIEGEAMHYFGKSDPQEVADFLNAECGYSIIIFTDKETYDIYYPLLKAMVLLEILPVLPKKDAKIKKQKPKFKHLPHDYVFRYGKYAGMSVQEVPETYAEWFKNTVPSNRW